MVSSSPSKGGPDVDHPLPPLCPEVAERTTVVWSASRPAEDATGTADLSAVVAAAGSSVVWIAAGAVGDDIALTVTRDGAERSLTATLGTQPAAGAARG